jgi:hypothetical protein
MPHIFHIAELLSLILQYHEEDRKTLARIARTSKLFMRADLPLLWRRMDTIIPLLQLLPNGAVLLERELSFADNPWLGNYWNVVSSTQYANPLTLPLDTTFRL